MLSVVKTRILTTPQKLFKNLLLMIKLRADSLAVGPQPSKLMTRVRIPAGAPKNISYDYILQRAYSETFIYQYS